MGTEMGPTQTGIWRAGPRALAAVPPPRSSPLITRSFPAIPATTVVELHFGTGALAQFAALVATYADGDEAILLQYGNEPLVAEDAASLTPLPALVEEIMRRSHGTANPIQDIRLVTFTAGP